MQPASGVTFKAKVMSPTLVCLSMKMEVRNFGRSLIFDTDVVYFDSNFLLSFIYFIL